MFIFAKYLLCTFDTKSNEIIHDSWGEFLGERLNCLFAVGAEDQERNDCQEEVDKELNREKPDDAGLFGERGSSLSSEGDSQAVGTEVGK